MPFSRYLSRLPSAQVEAVVPREAGPLVRVFPTLGSVEALASARRLRSDQIELQELRRRALCGLRELLSRIGDRWPLVLVIDDLQWGDEDSIAVLRELLAPPDPPVMLLICASRLEDADSSPCLLAFRALAGPESVCEWLDLPVLPLDEDARRELALALLAGAHPQLASHAAAIARHSGGYPFFIQELARHLLAGEELGEGVADDDALATVLWTRISRLAEPVRRLLGAIAVAGQPLGQTEAFAAARLSEAGREARAVLQAERLIRSAKSVGEERLDTDHARIRETVLTFLSDEERNEIHARLADVLDASAADPEWRAVHFLASGQTRRAGQLFALAADQSAETLAFDRAARLYRLALEHAQPDEPFARRLRIGLGDALARSGQAGLAAAEFQAVAASLPSGEAGLALELRRRAALLLLSSGRIDSGLAALDEVLGTVGLSLCSGPGASFWSLAWQRVRLLLRGLKSRPRSPGEVPPELLSRLDVCATASIGLSMVDTIQGAYFQSRALRDALDAGEPSRLGRALAIEAAHESIEGTRSGRRPATLFAHAEAVILRSGDPYGRGILKMTRGVAFALCGEWASALEACDSAEIIFRDECTGVMWELGTTYRFACWPLMYMGRIGELARRLPGLIARARECEDLYQETNLGMKVRTFVRLAEDEPTRAREELRSLMGRWSHRGFHVQHMTELFDDVQIDLYEGDGESARRRLDGLWRELERSRILMIQQIRIVMTHLRARAELAQPEPARLDLAAKLARSLARERAGWASAFAKLLEAGLAARRQQPAERLLDEANALCESASMDLFAASARWLRGQLIGGTEGRQLRERAEDWMRAQGIVRPDRMAMLLVPGVLARIPEGDVTCTR